MRNFKTSQSFWQCGNAKLLGAVAWLALCHSAVGAPFEQALQQQYRASGLPGLCVAAVDAQGVRYSAGLGLADVERGVSYDADTVQPVGSVSKTLIGLAIADLVTRGELDLQAPVMLPAKGDGSLGFKAQALKHPMYPTEAITWRQLATHTSGLLDEGRAYDMAYVKGREAEMSMAAYVLDYLFPAAPKALEARFAQSAPGQAYAYSNLGAAGAAVGLEQQTGISFDRFTQQRLLRPMGMLSSSWHFNPELGPRNATLYAADVRSLGRRLPPYTLITYADGGLHSSCNDLARYTSALLSAYAGQSNILPNAGVRLMLSPQLDSKALPKDMPVTEPNQGLFWQIRSNGTVGHSGSDPGLTAFISLDLIAGRGRVFLANGDIGERPKAKAAFAEIWRDLALR